MQEDWPAEKEKIKLRLCEWISDGGTVAEFCRQPGSPSVRSIYEWRSEDQDFAARFARARDCGEEVLLEQCLQIADTQMAETELELDGNDKVTRKSIRDALKHRALQIHTRMQILARWNPRRYGTNPETTRPVDITPDPRFE